MNLKLQKENNFYLTIPKWRFSRKNNFFSKIIIYNSVNNLLMFYSKYQHFSLRNIKLLKPLSSIFLNRLFFQSKLFFDNFNKKIQFKKKSNRYLSINKINFLKKRLNINLFYHNYFNKQNKNFWKWKLKNSKQKLSKGFLFLRSSKNNFFATILDNRGRTLTARSGGNNQWFSTRQKASVFSAENATFECCILAKKRGLHSVDVHLLSSLRIPQIKNSLVGLEQSGLKINCLLHRPKFFIGGCWLKKPRRV